MTTATAIHPNRILKFNGSCNFRDLGGYRTREGRELKWGRVYRTGILSYFAEDVHEQLRALDVRAICDLRRADEREREPTRWPSNSGTRFLSWDDGRTPPVLSNMAAKQPYTAAGMHAAMLDLYRALPDWMAPRIREMFACVLNDELPMIVHCAAGKDRTGVAIALLLKALDVPDTTIVEDYLLTNDAGDLVEFILAQHQLRHAPQLGLATTAHPLLEMPADIRQVLFAADAAYLQTAFTTIESSHGSVENYLQSVIGLDDADYARLRDRLLI